MENLKRYSQIWNAILCRDIDPRDEKSREKLYREVSPIVRKALGIKRFTSEQKREVTEQLVEMAVYRQNVRKGKFRKHSRLTRENLINRAIAKHTARFRKDVVARNSELVREKFENNYNMPSSSWAGGERNYNITRSNSPKAETWSEKVWSSNGKWSGNNIAGNINISKSWYKDCYLTGLSDAEGLLTTHATEIKPNLWQASWLEQSRGFSVKVIQGYILKYDDHFFHGATEEKCWKLVKKYSLAKVAKEKLKEPLQKLIEDNKDLKLTRRISKLAGNCESGTESWLNTHGFQDREYVSVKEAYQADPNNNRVLLAIKIAIRKSLEKPVKAA